MSDGIAADRNGKPGNGSGLGREDVKYSVIHVAEIDVGHDGKDLELSRARRGRLGSGQPRAQDCIRNH